MFEVVKFLALGAVSVVLLWLLVIFGAMLFSLAVLLVTGRPPARLQAAAAANYERSARRHERAKDAQRRRTANKIVRDRRRSHGFTLVELVVVIVISTLLALLALLLFRAVIERSQGETLEASLLAANREAGVLMFAGDDCATAAAAAAADTRSPAITVTASGCSIQAEGFGECVMMPVGGTRDDVGGCSGSTMPIGPTPWEPPDATGEPYLEASATLSPLGGGVYTFAWTLANTGSVAVDVALDASNVGWDPEILDGFAVSTTLPGCEPYAFPAGRVHGLQCDVGTLAPGATVSGSFEMQHANFVPLPYCGLVDAGLYYDQLAVLVVNAGPNGYYNRLEIAFCPDGDTAPVQPAFDGPVEWWIWED